MTDQEKKELQSLKERVAYLEGILFTLQGQKTFLLLFQQSVHILLGMSHIQNIRLLVNV